MSQKALQRQESFTRRVRTFSSVQSKFCLIMNQQGDEPGDFWRAIGGRPIRPVDVSHIIFRVRKGVEILKILVV